MTASGKDASVSDVVAPAGDYLQRSAARIALDDLENPASIESRHEQFLRLCEHATAGYKCMSPEQIAGAELTPKLMQYFLSALASYAARAGTARVSMDRRKILADAFGLLDEHGGQRQGLWTEEKRLLAVSAYAKAIHSQAGQEKTPAAKRIALSAAYDAVFGDDSEIGREKRQVRKNLKGLVGILADQGYLWPGDLSMQSK